MPGVRQGFLARLLCPSQRHQLERSYTLSVQSPAVEMHDEVEHIREYALNQVWNLFVARIPESPGVTRWESVQSFVASVPG